MIKCSKCGKEISEDDEFCRYCGTGVKHYYYDGNRNKTVNKKPVMKEEREPVSPNGMIIIWICLAYWGFIHHGFYSYQAREVLIGFITSGIVFLLCRKKLNTFWTYLWTIIALIIGMWPIYLITGLMFVVYKLGLVQ